MLGATAAPCARNPGTFAPLPSVTTPVTMPDGEDDNDPLLVLVARPAALAARILIFQRASDAFCGQQ